MDDERIANATEVPYDVALANDEAVWENEDDDCFNNVESACAAVAPGTIVWLCERVAPQVDVDRILEDFLNDYTPDRYLSDDATNVLGLKATLEAWNAKQRPTLYQSGEYKRYVVAPEFENDGEE